MSTKCSPKVKSIYKNANFIYTLNDISEGHVQISYKLQ